MSNIITDVGHGIKVGAVDTAKVIIKTVDFLPHAAEVIATAIKDQPTVKAAVESLITQAVAVIGDGSSAVADKGINLVDDAATLAAAESFFDYFKATFIPLIESVYTAIKADVSATPTS